MRILVSGSSGLIGSRLVAFLATAGHEVLRLVRGDASGDDEIHWNPAEGSIDREVLAGLDAVVHLAGENIAAGRWNEERKRRIRTSRVDGTRLLCESLSELQTPPNVFVCASAIGFYGDRGDAELDEESEPGTGFLSDVCRQWEAAANPARERGIRVVSLRFGVVLSRDGGALEKMLPPFKLGAGGVIGSGRQYWSWIAIDDVVGAIDHAITCEKLNGPVNCVAPNPVSNREFTRTLGRVLGRPTLIPLPAFAARLALGQMANELLLASARVIPKRLQETGYTFHHPQLEDALRHVLRKA